MYLDEQQTLIAAYYVK